MPPEAPAAAAEPQPAADQIVFDAGSGDALFGLEPEEDAKDQRVNAQESSDDLLFEAIAPLDDITLHVTDTSENAADVTEQPLQSAEAVTEPHAAALEPALSESSNLMPQDILKLQPQQLEGEWTVDKWEYWFRSSELSPALQELAQHGLMTGEIGGISTFHVPTQYERLVTQMQHLLEQALHTQWPSTRFDVKYEELEQLTPYALQHERKGKAFQRASELLHHEPVVDSLLAAFDGKLENIQLK